MDNSSQDTVIRRVMVGTDRSKTADDAVQWAAAFTDHFEAELFVVQGIMPAPSGYHRIRCRRADQGSCCY